MLKSAAWGLAAAAVVSMATPAFAYSYVDRNLFHAAAAGDVHAVRGMIESGAYMEPLDRDGLTPLAWAAQRGRTEVMTYMIKAGAHVNMVDHNGFTPLMWAAQQGQSNAVALLLAHGANANVVNRYGITAIALAQYAGSMRSTELIAKAMGYTGKLPTQWTNWGYRNGQWGYVNTTPAYWNQPRAVAGNWTNYDGRRYAASQWAYNGYRAPVQHRMPMTPGTTAARPAAKPVVRTVAAVPGMAPVVATPVVAAALASPVEVKGLAAPAGGEPDMIKKAIAIKDVAIQGKMFSEVYGSFLKESSSGGFSMSSLASMTSPDMELGKNLTMAFANFTKTQDLKGIREDVTKAKATPNLPADSRFMRFVKDLDTILTAAGV